MAKSVVAEDLFKLKSLTQVTQGGDLTFFVENKTDKETNSYPTKIGSVDATGKYQVWADGGVNTQPTPTPDFLFYVGQADDEKKTPQLFKMPLTGGSAEQVTAGKPQVQQVVASGDGSTLVFKTLTTDEEPKYKTTDFPKTRHVTKLMSHMDGYGWYPNDGVYTLNTVDVATGKVTKVFESAYSFKLVDVDQTGALAAYTRQTNPELDTDYDPTSGLYFYDLTEKTETWVTESVAGGSFNDASFSPDGQTVAVVGNDQSHQGMTVDDLWVYDVQSEKLTNLTHADDTVVVGFGGEMATDFVQHRKEKGVYWLDNNQYVFTALHHGHSQMYTGDKTGVKLVDDQPREVYDFDVVNSHTVALSVSKQDKPSELVHLDVNGGTEKALYNPNAEYEKNHTYTSPKHFNYKAKDGQALEGWYLPPVEAKAKNPVLLYVHGGPHAAYGESFFFEFQVYTTLGYGVVFVNPRGSTTYGQAFVDDVTGHYGQRDYTDVLDGLDYALEKFPELDEDHQYIAGGSYGGFMTTWTVGHTDRFAAAVAQRSVTNWIGMYGQSDIGFYFNRQELQADLFDPDGLKKYWEMSPLAYAHNVKTPLRLLHGEWDMRCPMSQSEEFFTAVKQTGTDVDLVRYPQAFHGVSRDGLPSLRVQRVKDMDEWFSRY